eukprot:8854078-Prorocentrum_lima.AAC.1
MDTQAVIGSSRSRTQTTLHASLSARRRSSREKASTHSMRVIGGFRHEKVELSQRLKATSRIPRRASA